MLTGLTQLGSFFVDDNRLTGTIPQLTGTSLMAFRVANNQLKGDVPSAPPNLISDASSLCPNYLNHTFDPAWDAATSQTPWYTNCVIPLKHRWSPPPKKPHP